MKKLQVIFLLLVVALVACDEPPFPKPENLIGEKKMIEMLVDIHLAESTYNTMRYDSIVKRSSSADFYYSVLDKYQMPDSVFEKSFVYYASDPKNFEKMYRKVMNELSEMEQEFSGRKTELLELEEEERRNPR